MTLAGDRRRHARFDIVGALWGQLELHESARIRNVSTSGILLDSSMPAALESDQMLQVVVEGQVVAVDTRVRRMEAVRAHGPDVRYLIGLEFVSPPVSVVQSIEQLSGNS